MPTADKASDVAAQVRLRVETWAARRYEANGYDGAPAGNLRKFIEMMNFHTRKMISATGIQDPNEWDNIAAIARLTESGASIIDPELRAYWLMRREWFDLPLEQPALWSGLDELATNAATLTSGARIKDVAAGADRTNL